MSGICELTGKKPLFGHKVSHSERKTNKKFSPNVHFLNLRSDILKKKFLLRVSTVALKSIEIKGGLDFFLLDANNKNLSLHALKLKKIIKKALEKKEA